MGQYNITIKAGFFQQQATSKLMKFVSKRLKYSYGAIVWRGTKPTVKIGDQILNKIGYAIMFCSLFVES